MNKKADFVDYAKSHLDKLGDELSDLDTKLRDLGHKADSWSSDQAAKLKEDWEKARTEMAAIAERIETEGEDAVGDARRNAERHWAALQAAVSAYRAHLEQTTTE